MDRLVSLSVGTEGAEDYFSTYQDISELARNLGGVHSYVTVTAQTISPDGEDEPDDGPNDEELYHDDQTIPKFRAVLKDYGLSDKTVSDLISNLHAAGILFRERRVLNGGG